MRAHVLQHVKFEDIGSMASWLDKSGANVTYTRFFEHEALPPIDGIDLIIIMGGPMSVNEESVFPWLCNEKKFIHDAVNKGVAVLGVCLGAQLIANALGARVYRNSQKEIGWFPVDAELGTTDTFIFPEKFTVFHWHGETFDLPAGAVRLARSKICENQAFQIGPNVIGLQFHLEVTPESIQSIIDNCCSELIPGPYIQTKPQLQRSYDFAKINNIMDEVLTYICRD